MLDMRDSTISLFVPKNVSYGVFDIITFRGRTWILSLAVQLRALLHLLSSIVYHDPPLSEEEDWRPAEIFLQISTASQRSTVGWPQEIRRFRLDIEARIVRLFWTRWSGVSEQNAAMIEMTEFSTEATLWCRSTGLTICCVQSITNGTLDT